MIEALGSGDKVITVGGFYGIVQSVKDDRVVLKIAEGTKVEVCFGDGELLSGLAAELAGRVQSYLARLGDAGGGRAHYRLQGLAQPLRVLDLALARPIGPTLARHWWW